MARMMDLSSDNGASPESFGLTLENSRTSLGLSLQDVSVRLLLSVNQIRGLEAENRQAFYNDWFYTQAAQKYAKFLSVPLPQNIKIAIDSAALSRSTKSVRTTDRLGNHPQVQAGLGKLSSGRYSFGAPRAIAGVSLVVLGAIAGFFAVHDFKGNESVALEASSVDQVVQTASMGDDKSTVDPAALVVSRDTSQPSELTLTFSGACWVQAIYVDGSRVEKIYKEGDTLRLKLATLTSLVLGNSVATTLTAGPIAVPLQPYTNRGSVVARITGSDLQTRIDRIN